MTNSVRSKARGSRAVPIAMIAFALLAVAVGEADPGTVATRHDNIKSPSQIQQAQADIKFGFAKQIPGEKLRIDPF